MTPFIHYWEERQDRAVAPLNKVCKAEDTAFHYSKMPVQQWQQPELLKMLLN